MRAGSQGLRGMKVLIIGASFCGLACAKQLLDNKGKLAGGKDGSTGLEVVLVRRSLSYVTCHRPADARRAA